MTDVLVLVGMSAREVQARDRLLALAGVHGASVAFLQLGDPSLSRELTRLADEGAKRIVLVGVSLGTLAPSNGWLRRIAGHWLRERPGGSPELITATSLLSGESELEDLLGRTRVVTGTQAPLTSSAWEDVTPRRHQVLVCRGPRCTALGSDVSAEALILSLMSHDQGDDDVLITHTGCQFPCNQGPVMFDATTGVVHDWMYDTLAKEYVLDETNQAFMRASNPWALQQVYLELEGDLEDRAGG